MDSTVIRQRCAVLLRGMTHSACALSYLPPPLARFSSSLRRLPLSLFFFFFFNDTATTEIYTLSLHDALPISLRRMARCGSNQRLNRSGSAHASKTSSGEASRSEEHTSELQSQSNLVCRLLLEKKKKRQRSDGWTAPSSGSGARFCCVA